MSLSEQAPTDLYGVLARTEEVYAHSSHTLEGTNPNGGGQTALDGLAYAIRALRLANEAVVASGEGGI